MVKFNLFWARGEGGTVTLVKFFRMTADFRRSQTEEPFRNKSFCVYL